MSNLKQISKDLEYLYSKINWEASNMDAEAIRIMNELGGNIKEAVEQKDKAIKALHSHYLAEIDRATEIAKEHDSEVIILASLARRDVFYDFTHNLAKILNNEPIE